MVHIPIKAISTLAVRTHARFLRLYDKYSDSEGVFVGISKEDIDKLFNPFSQIFMLLYQLTKDEHFLFKQIHVIYLGLVPLLYRYYKF